MLARANQKRRDAASTAGQWQNLGHITISYSQVISCEFYGFNLYDEYKNEEVERKRDPLVLISKDRFITIVDIEQTIAAVEADHVIIDRRFRTDQEATPTAVCFLKHPEQYLDNEELLKAELEKERGKQLKNQVNQALLSLQTSKMGPINATMRPELQPVD